MRGWKRQESQGWGCQPKIVIREKRRAGGRGRVRIQGGKRAGETQLTKLPGSCFRQPSARALCSTALRLTASAPQLPPRTWLQGTADLESLPPSSPFLAWGFQARALQLLSNHFYPWEGFSPRKSAISLRLEALRPPLCSIQMTVWRTSQEKTQRAYLQALCHKLCSSRGQKYEQKGAYTDFIMRKALLVNLLDWLAF